MAHKPNAPPAMSTFATDLTNVASNTTVTAKRQSQQQRAARLRQSQLPFAPRSSSPLSHANGQAGDTSSSVASCSRVPVTPLTSVASGCSSGARPSQAVAVGLRSPGATSPILATRLARQQRSAEQDPDHDSSVAEDDERDDAPDMESASKRRRTALCAVDSESEPVALWNAFNGGQRRIESLYSLPGTQLSPFQLMRRRELGARVCHSQVSMRPILRDIVSNNEEQVFRLPSSLERRNFAPPFVTAFNHDAKVGGKQLFVTGDEEGHVHLMDGGQASRWDAEASRTTFQAHQNAIFDLAWSHDDTLLATASGDQSIRLWDVQTQQCVGFLDGHTCTIKNVRWDPKNPQLLASASRDGSIRIWDRRTKNDDTGGVGTVNLIKNAHASKNKVVKGRSALRSVTAVSHLPQSEHLLASAGSADSMIKVWDLRKSHSRRVNPAFVETNEEWVSNSEAVRPHGISNMTLAPDGRRLYALCKDSRIYAFDPLNLTHEAPLASFHHPRALYGSFYVRVAVSPCSRYIASGSSESGIYVWDAQGSGGDAVRLVGHEKEVSGLDWGSDRLVSCSDDGLVRVWNMNRRVAMQRRGELEAGPEVAWRWSGEQA